jgi:hypothetical protein
MATTRLPAPLEATPFPAPGVAAGVQRAIAAARVIPPRSAGIPPLDGARGAGRVVDRTFAARRLHAVRRSALRGPSGAVGPSVSA